MGIVIRRRRGSPQVSLKRIGRRLGIPAMLIDLRHAAAHELLPDLQTLRCGADACELDGKEIVGSHSRALLDNVNAAQGRMQLQAGAGCTAQIPQTTNC